MSRDNVRSKISMTRKGSTSVKTVVPEGIADALHVSDGDYLEWEISAEGSRIVVKVRKVVSP